MVPGSVNQTVQVTSSQISLNTTTPEMSTTLETELVRTLPIEVSGGPRLMNAFVGQAPGVSYSSSQGSYLLSGGQTVEDSAYINGIPLLGGTGNGEATELPDSYPPYEMIKEFSVNVSTYSAQYGLTQGSVTYNTASGTNQLHGDAFDILRNSMFDSDGFFPVHFSADGHPAPPTNHQNDYGFTVSGPVIFPKLYNGRNRTFFLFTLDNYHENEYQNGFGTVPTAAEKTGDFSNYVDSNGNQIPIFDPSTGQQFEYNSKLNVIPPNRISQNSQVLLSDIPDPDRSGTGNGEQNNKTAAIPAFPRTIDLWGFTIDHHFNEKQSIHYAEWHHNSNNPADDDFPIVPANNPLSGATNNFVKGDSFLLNYVNTLTPNLVLTVGSSLYTDKEGSQDAVPYSLGSSFGAIESPLFFPSITFDGQYPVTTFGAGSQGNAGDPKRVDGLAVVNNWLWSKGRNTFNIGGEYRLNMRDEINCEQCNGEFSFSHRTTSTPNTNDPNFDSYGSSFASFLLGDADSAFRIKDLEMKLRSSAYSAYIEDNIKVNSRLTVDAGLRWDVLVPFNDALDNVVFIDLTKPDPGTGLLGAGSKFGNCPLCTGTHRANIHWKNFGPRLGLSYMLNNKTVIQAGFYTAFLNTGAYNFGNARINGWYNTLQAGAYAVNSNGTNVPGYGNWDVTPLIDPPAVPFSPDIVNGNYPSQLDVKTADIAPYTQQWVLSVQRQLPWNQFLTVAYIGNRIIHLASALNDPNQLYAKYLSYGPLLGEMANSPDAVAAGIKIPYPNFLSDLGSNATVEQALLPYPQLTGLDNNFDAAGTTFYNALEVQGEKRFSNGLSYLASLTLAKNMSNQDFGDEIRNNFPVNTYDQKLEWAPSVTDVPYMVKIDVTYALPIGRGQMFLNSKGLLANLLGGWQVAAILNYEQGNPVGDSQDNAILSQNNADGDNINRPDAVSGAKQGTYNYSRSKDYFEGKVATQPVQITTDAFTPSCYYCVGNAKRNYTSMHTQPLKNENLDAMKSFHITDRVNATLRVDYFNAFNRTNLQAPDNDIDDSTFGMVTSESSGNRQGQATFRVDF
ncbi:MAG: hypothetical protein ACLQMO_15445 [Acidobacteriaceae bacterium]